MRARACRVPRAGAASRLATSRGTSGTERLSGRGPACALAAVRKLKEDWQPVCVSDRLFVGSVGVRGGGMRRATALVLRLFAAAYCRAPQAAHNRDGLLAAGITHVLCVAVGLPRPFPSDFRYHTIEARFPMHLRSQR